MSGPDAGSASDRAGRLVFSRYRAVLDRLAIGLVAWLAISAAATVYGQTGPSAFLRVVRDDQAAAVYAFRLPGGATAAAPASGSALTITAAGNNKTVAVTTAGGLVSRRLVCVDDLATARPFTPGRGARWPDYQTARPGVLVRCYADWYQVAGVYWLRGFVVVYNR